jgi:hypothetical protein
MKRCFFVNQFGCGSEPVMGLVEKPKDLIGICCTLQQAAIVI